MREYTPSLRIRTARRLRRIFWPDRPSPAVSHKRAIGRLKLTSVCIAGCFLALSAKAVHLTLIADMKTGYSPHRADTAERGVITDRNGTMLAHNVPLTVLHADPKHIMDLDHTVQALAPYLPHKSAHQLRSDLSRNTRYVALDRKLTPSRHADILNLGLPGIYFSPSVARIYPQGREAAHLLGQLNTDGQGIAGLEKSLNARLQAGEDVALSIDISIQAIIRRQLQAQIARFEAIGGAGLLLDIQTGELISAVSLPDYDPNHYQLASVDSLFNNATKGVFEMGSIFKVLNTAIALETNASTVNSSYDVRKPIRVSRHRIGDYHPYDRHLNLTEVLVFSSNIGSARIAEQIGTQRQKAYMDKLGLLKRPDMRLPETAAPLLPANWGRLASMTISFGHGMSVTPVHAVSAIAAAAGHGEYIEPTLLKRTPGELYERRRIFSEETVRAVRTMMRLVVTHKEGTANFADAKGYMVGAKTGTAEKIKNKGYDRKANRVSLVASFPVSDPRYLLFVMVDEPQGQKHSYGFATAGWVAAPLARDIITHISPMLNVFPVAQDAPEIEQNLIPDLLRYKNGAIVASF